ncbi:hypothetical protein P5673_005842 [Acropora cervicornis]|uniref:Uncharacterized protein n=1 Tax=Acropora cervicornis TaxID=6130 RepID=A0AAD9QZH4_ACRCE|nr:hypothetical protein P5673_005842 [Acropora cervicornis]
MGLLPNALKTLEILEKPEVIFKRRLKSNPFHPFNNIGGNSAGEMYYYVVLNGFHITEQKITSYTKNDKVC